MSNLFAFDDYNVTKIRARFPSLTIKDNGANRIYLDNPGGTQICQSSLDQIQNYLLRNNANSGGTFRTSLENSGWFNIVDFSNGQEINNGQTSFSINLVL